MAQDFMKEKESLRGCTFAPN